MRCGGGINHRFGLDDAILIKDNHIAVAGGVVPALRAAKDFIGHLVKIEIEVDRLDQLREVLTEGADVVLLDNMSPAQLREAVALIGGRIKAEASGGIHLDGLREVAETGVDLISSAPSRIPRRPSILASTSRLRLSLPQRSRKSFA